MIHTARQTAKFTKLVRRLRKAFPGLPVDPEVVATGILEQLWHFTITSARRGDIGQHDDELIAEACGWLGDPEELISILTDTGWVDHCTTNRLVVHDWNEHAPAFIKRNIDRLGGFVCAVKRPLNRSAEQGSDRLTAQNTSQVLTPNLTKPNQTKPNQIYSSEPCQASEPVEASIVFELVGRTPGPWNPPISVLNQLQEYYPAVDVVDEVRRAAAWHHCNPNQRKTKNGILKFLNAWLTKSNDRGPPAKRSTQPSGEHKDLIKTWRKRD